MAKFKVGDKVGYYGKESKFYRQRGRVSDVSQIRGETFVTVDLDNGEELGAPEKDWTFMNAVRSTNSVVQNALAAKNGVVEDKYRVTLDTLTLDGKGKTSKVVTAAKLKQILTFLRQPQAFDTVLSQVAKHGRTDVAAEVKFELNLAVEKA